MKFTSANTVARPHALVAFLTVLAAIFVQLLLPARAQFFFGAEPSECSVLDRIKWVHPRVTGNDLMDIGYFADLNETDHIYMAVGRGGVTVHSGDADCWEYQFLGDTTDLFNVTGGELTDARSSRQQKFYAGSRRARLASWDVGFRTWGVRTVNSAPQLNGVRVDFLGVSFGEGRLVVVTSGGYSGWTSDLDNWTWRRAMPLGMTNDLVSIAYRDGRWVAASTTNVVVYSSDGENWLPSRIEVPLKRIRASGGGYLGVSNDERIGTSADGQFWSFVENHRQGVANDIAGFSGEIVLVGDKSLLSSSATLRDWRKIQMPLLVTNENFNAVIHGPNSFDPFVAVGDRGTILRYSAGSTRAVSGNNDILFDLHGVAYGAGAYAAVGERGTIWSKVTGTNGALYTYYNDVGGWDARGSGTTNDLTGIAFGNRRFVAMGGAVEGSSPHALILTSSDTVTWATVFRQNAIVDQATGAKAYPKSIAFGGGRFVILAQGEAGAALVSLDGTRWETQFNPLLNGMKGIGFGNGRFIAVGERIATSEDGFNWTADESAPATLKLYSATGANGTWVAVGEAPSFLITKTNGGSWQASTQVTNSLYQVTFAAGSFAAVGNAGAIYSSADGIRWDLRRNRRGVAGNGRASAAQRGIVFGNGEYAVVGDRGDISVTPKADPTTGVPSPAYFVSTGGGTDHDLVNSIAFSGTALCDLISVGATRRIARFGNQILGDTNTPSTQPSFFLARHSDTGTVTFAASGPVNSIGTHVSSLNNSVLAGGSAFDTAFPARDNITSGGTGFVVAIDEFTDVENQRCLQKQVLSRTDRLRSDFNWARHFNGTLTDLKQLTRPAFSTNFPVIEARFSGVFGTSLDMGDGITIDSTNALRSFFLTKCNAFGGTNAWVRWFEPTNQPAVETIYGLKLAVDGSGNTIALGAISGGLNIYSNVPNADASGGGGAVAQGGRSGRPALAEACPPGHATTSSALEGGPCEEACPPGHSPTLSTLLGSPCADGGGGGDTNTAPNWVRVGRVPREGRPPGLAMFLSVFDINGGFIWAGNFGPIGSIPVAVETDSEGIIYVAANISGGDVFVGAYKSLGRAGLSNLWTRSFTPGGGAQLTALHARPEGVVFAAGTFQNSASFAEPDTFGSTNITSGGTASFLLRMEPNGKLRKVYSVGVAEAQSGFSVVNSLYSMSPGRITLGGYFIQQATFGSIQVASRGLGDAFVATVDVSEPPLPPPPAPGGLTISRSARGIRLEWTGDAILQRTTSLSSPVWVDLDVASPLELSAAGTIQCYRLRAR